MGRKITHSREFLEEEFLKRNLKIINSSDLDKIPRPKKIEYKCLKCGIKHCIRIADLLQGKGCPSCKGNKKLSFEEVKKTIENTSGFEVVDDGTTFKNVHSTLKIKHECGLIYQNCFNNFRNGQRCPFCEKKSSSGNMSKQFRHIVDYLLTNNENFTIEKKYPDLKISKRSARYDLFFEELNLLVEFQGKQHFEYEENGYFNKEKFEKIIMSDKIKKEYAEKNNINLEYITYKENEIEKIKEVLAKYKI